MNTDPIADYLTRLRNASKATHKVVDIPASNIKKEITRILKDKGYILNYKFEETGGFQKANKNKYAWTEKICRHQIHAESIKWFRGSHTLYFKRSND